VTLAFPIALRQAALFVALMVPLSAAAQTVTGIVVDSATGRPIEGVTVVVRAARDSVFLRGAVTNDVGRFSLTLLRGDSVVTSVRHIGFRTKSAAPAMIDAKATRTYRFEMAAIPSSLDTVRTTARRVLRGMFYELTAGQEWFSQHSAAGKGFFLSGMEMQLSGVTPCDFFSEMPGFSMSGVLPTGVTGIGCYWQRAGPLRFIVPADQASCVEAYLDRQHRLVGVDSAHFITASSVEGGLTWHRLDRVRGIEMFARYEDRPRDFSTPPANRLPEIGAMSPRTTYRFGGSKNASEPPRSTNDFSRAGQQRCALILVWTEKYWGG
jgi:5-hydroxyisourate hydrolase-like protein (transthyretin family)